MHRISAELIDASIVASRKRIAVLMRGKHVRGLGFCITTERDMQHRPVPDFVNWAFVATDTNQLWVANMIYIPT